MRKYGIYYVYVFYIQSVNFQTPEGFGKTYLSERLQLLHSCGHPCLQVRLGNMLSYFQFCSKWPWLWFNYFGNPLAISTSPCQSSHNQGTPQNNQIPIYAFFITQTHNIFHICNNFSCNYHTSFIPFYMEYLCTAHQKSFDFYLCLYSPPKIFH